MVNCKFVILQPVYAKGKATALATCPAVKRAMPALRTVRPRSSRVDRAAEMESVKMARIAPAVLRIAPVSQVESQPIVIAVPVVPRWDPALFLAKTAGAVEVPTAVPFPRNLS